MYQTYRYAVLEKNGFSDIEMALLNYRNQAWNELATLYNKTLSTQKEYIRQFNQGAVNAVEEAASLSLRNKSGIKLLLDTWFLECKIHTTRIRQLWDEFKQKRAEYMSELDIWWPNKDKLYFQHDQARKSQYKLVREIALRPTQAENLKGAFHYRFHKPVKVEEILNKDDGAVGIYKVAGTTNTFRIRMTLDKSPKERDCKYETSWLFKMHRPLPENCEISGICLNGHTDPFGRWEGQVAFTIKVADPLKKEMGCIAGVDIGWRFGEQGMLCATVCYDDNVFERLFMPPEIVSKWIHLEELGMTIQNSLPDNVKINWFKYATLGQDLVWLKLTRKHREEWHHTFRKLRAYRRQLFYTFANHVTNRSKVICLEKLNLIRLQAIQSLPVRGHQRMVSPSLLIEILKECAAKKGVYVEEIKSNSTTQICFECGHLNKKTGEEARKTDMKCENCFRHYDPDENAAANIRKWGYETMCEKMDKSAA